MFVRFFERHGGVVRHQLHMDTIPSMGDHVDLFNNLFVVTEVTWCFNRYQDVETEKTTDISEVNVFIKRFQLVEG